MEFSSIELSAEDLQIAGMSVTYVALLKDSVKSVVPASLHNFSLVALSALFGVAFSWLFVNWPDSHLLTGLIIGVSGSGGISIIKDFLKK